MRARGLASEGLFYLYLLGLGGATCWSIGVNVVDEGGLLEPRRRRLGDLDGVLVVIVLSDCRGNWPTPGPAGTDDRDGGSCGSIVGLHLQQGLFGTLKLVYLHTGQGHTERSTLHNLTTLDNQFSLGGGHMSKKGTHFKIKQNCA